MNSIDINSDMGEIPQAILDGTQESMMPSLTSVNIACGGHAGDETTMKLTVEQALRCKLAIGAHPGYPDRENFGRVDMNLPNAVIEESVFTQVRALGQVAEAQGASMVHVKCHGQLYNQAVNDLTLARAIARGVARFSKNVIMVGLVGSKMLDVFKEEGFAIAAEAFADRMYEPDGTLRSRKYEDALIRDPAKAAEQALRIVQKGEIIASNGASVPIVAQTICIHSDKPGAPAVAAAVAKKLKEVGVQMRALSRA